MQHEATKFGSLRGDFFGGLTAGIVALPLALAFGVASGAGAAAGLYGAIAVGLFAAIFGGTRTQISGPTGPMTVVAASAIAAFSGDYQAVLAVVLLCGIIQIALGMARLGTLVRYIPYPVISGFMNGIGIIIILLQIHPLIGAPSVSSPMAAVTQIGTALAATNMDALILGGLTLAIVFFCPAKISRVVPSPLIALLVGTGLSMGMHMDVQNIGSIPAGFPMPQLPAFDMGQFSRIFTLAIALAALGAIDSLLTSIVADSLTKERHNSNRELIGQGIGNMVAAFIGGLPGAGATMRTVVNINAGGTSRVSGVIHSIFLFAIILGLGPTASNIPMCVLAGILIKVGVDIIDYRMIKLCRSIPKPDLAVMVTVFAITVFVDLIVAVGVGVSLASLMLTYRLTRQAQIRISEATNGAKVREAERCLQAESDFHIRVISIHGPFFFGTAAQMQDKIGNLLGTKVVVVNCHDVPFMDVSAAFTLAELIEKFQAAHIRVMISAHTEILDQLKELGPGAMVGEENLFDNHNAALHVAEEFWFNQEKNILKMKDIKAAQDDMK